MGILKTVVKASVAKSVIRTAGDVATKGISFNSNVRVVITYYVSKKR